MEENVKTPHFNNEMGCFCFVGIRWTPHRDFLSLYEVP